MTNTPRPIVVPMYCHTCGRDFDLTGIDETVRSADISPSECPHCGFRSAYQCSIGRYA